MIRIIAPLAALLASWPLWGHPARTKSAPIIRHAVTTQKVLALTFDDGPSLKWTPKILAVLNKAHVKATFFIIGSHATRRPQLVHEEVKDHMNIGSHGAEHLILRRESAAVIRQEVDNNAQILRSLGAPPPTLYRLPGGASDAIALKVLGQMGYTVVGWSIDTRDWRHRSTAEELAAQVEREASPGAIVIFHDGPKGSQATVAAVQMIISALTKQGYRFVTVNQLLALEHQARTHVLFRHTFPGSPPTREHRL